MQIEKIKFNKVRTGIILSLVLTLLLLVSAFSDLNIWNAILILGITTICISLLWIFALLGAFSTMSSGMRNYTSYKMKKRRQKYNVEIKEKKIKEKTYQGVFTSLLIGFIEAIISIMVLYI